MIRYYWLLISENLPIDKVFLAFVNMSWKYYEFTWGKKRPLRLKQFLKKQQKTTHYAYAIPKKQ